LVLVLLLAWTSSGHDLGRIIYEGEGLKNTGITELIAEHASDRVIHAEGGGIPGNLSKIGDLPVPGRKGRK